MTGSRPLPRHVQISEQLIREITSGLLPDGTRLPPERQMAVDVGVAIGTLRKALASLEAKGLIERIQGSGNYVRRKSRVDSVYAQFRLERPQGGGLPSATIQSMTEAKAPYDAVGFGLPEQLLCVERIRRLDGQDVAVERIWLSSPRIRETPDRISESLYGWYRDALGIVIARIEDKVGVAPLPDGIRLNALSAGDPVGFIERRAWDQAGQPAEYSQSWFDPTHARFFSRSESDPA